MSHSRTFDRAGNQFIQVAANPLRPSEISELYELFCEWASYSPQGNKAMAVIEIRAGRKKKAKIADTFYEAPVPAGAGEGETGKKAEIEEETDDIGEVEPGIGILNSFFIQDIERAMATVRSGRISRALKSYLLPPQESRVNLDSDEGYWAIFDALHPKHLNRGHWLNEPDRAMSLMQQSAINSALRSSVPTICSQ